MIYKIPVTWQAYGMLYIEANSLQDAVDAADESPLPKDSEYINDSFEVDIEGIPYNNPEVTAGEIRELEYFK